MLSFLFAQDVAHVDEGYIALRRINVPESILVGRFWVATEAPLVRELQQRGISVWWFDGDREAALQSFTARGTVSLEAFRNQMGEIEKGWNQIKVIIGNRVINAVAAGPTHLAPEKIFLEMFRTDGCG